MILFEFVKLGRSFRPLVSILSLMLFVALMLFGFYTYASKETGGEVEFRYTYENASYFNGLTFALYALFYGSILVLPIFAATEGGSQIAGETSSGTLHMMLARPLSKRRLFFSKLIASSTYLFLLVGFFLGLVLCVGLYSIGWGDLDIYPGVLQVTDTRQHLTQNEAVLRFVMAWPAAALSLFVTLCFSLVFSVWMRSPVNAVGTSVALYLVLYVISEIHFFRELRPYLFTSYLSSWRSVFREEIPWAQWGRDLSKLGAFSCFFLALSYGRFRRREET